MSNKLSCLIVRGCKAESHDDIVQTAFQLGEQVFTGDALLASGLLEIAAKLIFENSVNSFDLLFLAQLQSISDDLCPTGMSVLAWLKVSLLDGA